RFMTVRLDQCLGNASFTLLASCAGLVVSLALAAAWLLGGLLGLSSLIERGLLLAVMLALAGGLQFAVWQCFQATQKRAIRSIRLLCQTNYLELAEQPAAEQVDRRLSPEWRSALEQLSSQMLEYAGRLK